MTTSDNASKFRYEGNGVTDTFAFSSRIFNQSDLIVEIILRADDSLVETLTLTTDYTVTINNDESASVVVNAGKIPSSTQDIQIRRLLPLTQNLNLPSGTVFPAASVENALDKITAKLQEVQESLDRKVGIPVTDSDEAPDVITLLQDATEGAEDAQTAAEAAQTAAETAQGLAEDQVDYAEEWAQKAEDSAVSVAAGGDNSTTFSALHHAAKAAASALTATIGNLFGLTTATVAGGDFLAFSDTDDSNNGKKATVANTVLAGLAAASADIAVNSQKITGLADPTNAQDAATKTYVDDEVGGISSGGLVLLGSYTASNATSVDVGSGLDLDAVINGTYDEYLLVGSNVVPATDGASAYVRTSTDGGSTFDNGSGNYNYGYIFISSGGGGPLERNSTSATQIQIAENIGNASTECLNFALRIHAPSSANQTQIGFTADWIDASTSSEYCGGNGARLSAADIDAIRIFMSSGNISSGIFYLYGIAKS